MSILFARGAAGSQGNALYIESDHIYLLASELVRGPEAIVDTNDSFHTYRIEVEASGMIRVYQDGTLVLTGSTFASTAHHGGGPRISWGDTTNAGWATSEWRVVRHDGHARGCPYNATWRGSSGVMPTASCPPWLLGVEGTPPPATMSGDILTISTGVDFDTETFGHAGSDISVPNLLAIEATARFVSSNSQLTSRTGMRIQWTLDASGKGNGLYIGAGEIFLLSSNTVRGPGTSVDTSGGFHVYRIEVDAGDTISVFYDGNHVLTGTNFVGTDHNGSIPRIQWGDSTRYADGTSQWKLVRHNAHATGCDQDEDGERVELDCNDSDACTWSGTTELCDGRDNDCDGLIDEGSLASPGPIRGLRVSQGTVTELRWLSCGGATFDVVKGDLLALLGSGGNFTSSLLSCVEDDSLDAATTDADPFASGAVYYVVRAVLGCGAGTYDEGGSQAGSRDVDIQASGAACP